MENVLVLTVEELLKYLKSTRFFIYPQVLSPKMVNDVLKSLGCNVDVTHDMDNVHSEWEIHFELDDSRYEATGSIFEGTLKFVRL